MSILSIPRRWSTVFAIIAAAFIFGIGMGFSQTAFSDSDQQTRCTTDSG